jgi:hypothetical protein
VTSLCLFFSVVLGASTVVGGSGYEGVVVGVAEVPEVEIQRASCEAENGVLVEEHRLDVVAGEAGVAGCGEAVPGLSPLHILVGGGGLDAGIESGACGSEDDAPGDGLGLDVAVGGEGESGAGEAVVVHPIRPTSVGGGSLDAETEAGSCETDNDASGEGLRLSNTHGLAHNRVRASSAHGLGAHVVRVKRDCTMSPLQERGVVVHEHCVVISDD